jgi:hypothetical protein
MAIDVEHPPVGAKLELYISPSCPYCREALKYYDQHGIAYTKYGAQRPRITRENVRLHQERSDRSGDYRRRSIRSVGLGKTAARLNRALAFRSEGVTTRRRYGCNGNVGMQSRYLAFLIVTLAAVWCAASPLRAQVADSNPACRQTPGSYPQAPLQLVTKELSPRSSTIAIESVSGAADLQRRVERVIFVPPSGPLEVVTASHTFARIDPTIENGQRASIMTIVVPVLAPGSYRVLVEDRDLSAPAGCAISFTEAIGEVTVSIHERNTLHT